VAAVPPPSGQASQYAVVADFNGDGILDAVNLSDGTATVLLFAADGSVQSTTEFPVSDSAYFGVAGDFNGDGKQDLALSDNNDGTGTGSVVILLGNGDGTFQSPKTVAVAGNPFSIAAADFNRDGNLDIAVTDESQLVAWVLLGNGDGTLRSPVSIPSGGAGRDLAGSILAADFNNDGIVDLAVLNDGVGDPNTIAVSLGKGGGTFQAPVLSQAGNGELGSLSYADFNGDGKLDLAIAYGGSNSISMVMGNGDGTFQAAANYVTGSQPGSVTPIPLNDGTFALFTLDQISGEMIVSPGNSDGTLNMPPIYSLDLTGTAVAAADLNGDHIPDVMYYVGRTGEVGVMLMSSDLTLNPPVTYQTQTGPGAPAGPQNFATGDLNGDGVADVVIANSPSTTGTVSVLLGKGDGTLGAEHTYQAGSFTSAVVLADFDGDGKLDAAVVNTGDASSNTDTGNVSVLIGNGDGSFKPPVNYSAGSLRPFSLVTGDFNGDGKPDLAISTSQTNPQSPMSSSVVILMNNRDGTFKTASTLPTGPGPYQQLSMAAGDFNGDGKVDLAVLVDIPNGSNNTISIFLGNGDGTFQTGPVTTSIQSGLEFLLMADFNGDGHRDLMASDGFDATFLLGDGDGTFQSEQHITFTGPAPQAAALADFNGDGQPDMVFVDVDSLLVALGNAFPTISVAPLNPTLTPSQTQQFNVTGYFGNSTAVTWSLTPQIGTISAAGLYTAPASISTPLAVTVTATSVSNTNHTFNVVVNLTPAEYTLTITATPAAGGAVTPASGSTYAPGTVVQITAVPASGYQFSGWTGPVASAASASTTVTMNAAETVTANFTATGHPAFFSGEDFLSGTAYYLQFPDSNVFGYYEYLSSSILYHFDMGFEAFIPGTGNQIYFYDFTSSHWWYSSSSLFPYLYDFTLNSWIYYFANTTNPRYFSNLTTGKVFTM
jgi:hypothetical protein